MEPSQNTATRGEERVPGHSCERPGCSNFARDLGARRKHGRFCSSACRAAAWKLSHACGVARLPQAPEIKRQAAAKDLILRRLQDGPALGAELVACGGGFRFGARLRELRAAGNHILAENLGDGVWRYTLVQP